MTLILVPPPKPEHNYLLPARATSCDGGEKHALEGYTVTTSGEREQNKDDPHENAKKNHRKMNERNRKRNVYLQLTLGMGDNGARGGRG